jgi:DNA repair protein RecO (recombination protein O)
MITKSSGIVIRTSRFSETSAITKIYTRLKGMLSFHIPGVYSLKGTIKPAILQPLQIVEMDIYLKENRNLNKIKEIRPKHHLNGMHFDFHKASIGLFISEILIKTIREEEKNEELYDFLEDSILLFDKTEIPPANIPLYFLLELSKYLGFYPGDTHNGIRPYFDLYEGKFYSSLIEESRTIEPPHSEFLGKLMASGSQGLATLQIPRSTRQYLLKKIILYYHIHMADFQQPNSLTVLEGLYSSLK